jgi:hypothetical protein
MLLLGGIAFTALAWHGHLKFGHLKPIQNKNECFRMQYPWWCSCFFGPCFFILALKEEARPCIGFLGAGFLFRLPYP